MSDAIALNPAGAVPPASPPVQYYDLSGEHHPQQGTLLGFWLYLMSDLLIFACLFAVYGVLGRSYAAGPTGADLFDLPLIAVNTAMLLFSSITYGFAMLAMQRRHVPGVLAWLAVTGLFGLAFLGIELYEFAHLIHEGAGPQRSAFLTSFFALVGTHGLHVTGGLIWLTVMFIQLSQDGLTQRNKTRMACLSLFWHFLDLIWIGVFSVVYLTGAM